MPKLLSLSVLVTVLLAGCGQVVVFGHVVREGTPKTEDATPAGPGAASADAPSQSAASPATAASVGNSAVKPAATQPPAHTVKSVTLNVSSQATTTDEAPLSEEALLSAIRTELKSRHLLDDQATGTADIHIDTLALRPTTNAIVFGYKMMAGTLTGDIRLGDASTFHVIAESRLTLAADGQGKSPLGPLYHRFAVLTADRLAGVESKTEDPNPRF